MEDGELDDGELDNTDEDGRRRGRRAEDDEVSRPLGLAAASAAARRCHRLLPRRPPLPLLA